MSCPALATACHLGVCCLALVCCLQYNACRLANRSIPVRHPTTTVGHTACCLVTPCAHAALPSGHLLLRCVMSAPCTCLQSCAP